MTDSILDELMPDQTSRLTNYDVTLKLSLDHGTDFQTQLPDAWDWHNRLELGPQEKVRVIKIQESVTYHDDDLGSQITETDVNYMPIGDAFDIVLDLARGNIVDDSDTWTDDTLAAEQKRQELACNVVEEFIVTNFGDD